MADIANLDVAERLDITIKRGDSFQLSFNFKDSSGNNIPLLTDRYEFIIQVKTPETPSRRSYQTRSSSQFKTGSSTPERNLIAASSLEESKTQNVSDRDEAESAIFTFEEKDDLGNVILRATAANTATLPVGSFVYDLQYKYLDNGFQVVRTVLEGDFVIKEDISTAV